LSWKEKDSVWTGEIFGFFTSMNQQYGYEEQRDYMLVDYIWRNTKGSAPTFEIVLAVEHENVETDIGTILSKEISHLIDLKALNKVAVVYPSLGDEEELVRKLNDRLKRQLYRLSIGITPTERFLLITGFPTKKERKLAIQWKGHFFDSWGNYERTEKRVVWQKD